MNDERPAGQAQPDNSENRTVDLRKHAEEALRLLREKQIRKEDSNAVEAPGLSEEDLDAAASLGNTTYDLAREAAEAMRRMQAAQARKQNALDTTRRIFAPDMLLRLEVPDYPDATVIDVQGELVVGRSDNVTGYVPEIDLTVQGGYRLGLSRRHVLLSRVGETLKLTDLGSRNGTLINDDRLSPNESRILQDGDEIQLGNLVVRVRFQRRD